MHIHERANTKFPRMQVCKIVLTPWTAFLKFILLLPLPRCFPPGENCRNSRTSTGQRLLIILNYMVLLWYVHFCVLWMIDQNHQTYATYDLVHTKPLLLYIRWYGITEIDQLTLLHHAIWHRRNSCMYIRSCQTLIALCSAWRSS